MKKHHPYWLFFNKGNILFFSITLFLLAGSFSALAQAPTISSFTPTTVCQGSGSTITITGTNFTGATKVTLGSVDAASFKIIDATTITAVVANNSSSGDVTVTTPKGNATLAGLTVLPAPIPILTDLNTLYNPFTNCDGNLTYTINVKNGSTALGGSGYDINWGDNSTHFVQKDWPSGATTSHTYSSQGYFDITLTITPSNGCNKSITYHFYNGVNPLASITTSKSTTGLCAPATIDFQIGNWFNNSTGTTYQLDFGDGSQPLKLQHPLNADNTVQIESYQYKTSSCPNTDFTATLKAINGCFTTTYTLNQIVIRIKPTADFSIQPNPACLNSPVCLTNKTKDGFSGTTCNTTTNFVWDFGDGSPPSNQATPPCHTYAAAGPYSITLTASNAACGSDTKTQKVTVEPISPTPTATNVSYCQNQPPAPLTATGTGLLWYYNQTGGQSYPSITPPTGAVGTITYYVSQTQPNSCESPRVPVTVTVSASPNASIAYAAICTSSQVAAVQITGSQGGTFAASPAGLVIDAATGTITPGTSAPGTYTVTYTIAPSPPCLGISAKTTVTVTKAPSASIAYSPTSLCNAQGSPVVNVTQSGNSGGVYTISPSTGLAIDATTGTLSPSNATPGAYTVTYTVQGTGGCANITATAKVTVSSSPTANVTYPAVCSSDATANPVIAGSQGGTFTASPTGLVIDAATGTVTPGGSKPGKYTITYTIAPSSPCPGFTTTATVTITPAPSAAIAYDPSSLCNAQGSPVVQVTQSGNSGGGYTITPATGLAIDATTGTLSPSNATPGAYTVTYTVQGTGGCKNAAATAKVNVSSSPTANVTYPAVCSSDATANPVIVGSQGGTFTASPTGLVIDAATGTVTPGGSKPGTYTITYTIAPSSPCPGFTTTANVTITPAPSAAIAYDPSSLCNAQGSPVVQVTQAGNSGGVYTISPSTGLAIDATTGTLSPSNATPGAYTVTYTVQGTGGCKNAAATAKVNVSSAPTAKVSYAAVCGSDATAKPVVTGAQGGTFTASPVGLVIDAATGTITPGTSTPGTYTVTYTIAASPPCPGFTTTATVTVTKAPSAAIGYNPSSLCNVTGNPPVSVTLTGSAGGVYTISPSTGLAIDAATGTLSPANAKPGLYTVTYTVQGTGGCANITATANVTVSSAPTATIIFPAVCSSDITAKPVVTGVQGGTFTSAPAGLVIDAASGTITPGTSTPGTYTVTYSIAASPPCPGFTTTATVTVTKAPSAAIGYAPSSVCNATTNNPPVSVTLTGSAGGVYTISPAAGLPIDAATGTITPSGATAGNYTITYSVLGTGGCANITTTTNVTVSSAPIASINYPGAPFCTGVNTLQQATVSGTLGGSFSATQGLSIDPTTGAINPSLSKPGTYTVTYTIQASAPCPGFVATTSVEIDESPVVTFTPSDQPVCSGGTAVFTPSSTVTNTKYSWSVVGALPNGVTGPVSGTVSGPGAVISVSYINSTQTSQVIKIQVLPTNASQNPCAGAPYTLTLHINPIPAALTGDTTEFCMHTPPAALTADPSPGNTVNWYDVNLALLPAAPVINTTVPATFTYYASQTNGFGCEGPKATFTAVVNPTAKIVSSSYRSPDSCGVPSGKIILSVVDLNDNPIPNINVTVHYTKFGTLYTIPERTDASGQIIVRLVAGTYSNIYVETYGCLSQPIPDVFVLKDPTPPARPTAGYNAPVCSETPLNLSASSPTSSQQGPVYYVWVGPAFGNVADTSQNTVVSFPSASTAYNGTYIVYAIQNNCISSDTSFQVVVQQSPSKPKILTRTPLCVGDNLTLQAFSSIPGNNTIQYSWAGPGTGFPVSGSYAAINDVTVSDGGIYSVTVSSPETGCSSTSDTLVQIGGYPMVKLPQDSLTLPAGYLLTLAPVITNENDPNVLPIKQYAWAPSQYLVCNDSACSSPTVTITNNVCYSVKATNIYGCSGSDTVCVKVFCKNSQVFIPNAFTPRAGLAENAKFTVRSSGISSVKSFRIFNRWGKIVFERDNFSPNDPSFGWDGTVNGKAADTGVYIYTVEVVCDNGVPFTYNGNVTLL